MIFHSTESNSKDYRKYRIIITNNKTDIKKSWNIMQSEKYWKKIFIKNLMINNERKSIMIFESQTNIIIISYLLVILLHLR